MNISISRYEIFLKAAQLGSLTKAAEVMHYTQSGVSHAITALEQEAGFSLLRRSPGGVALTEAGARLLPAVQQLVNAQYALTQRMHEINHRIAGTLRLGTISSVSAGWLPEIITQFQELYPEVQFDLQDGEYRQVTQWLLHGQADCGFLAAPVAEPLTFSPMKQDPMVLVLPKGHPLSQKPAVSMEEIIEEPFIMETENWELDLRTAYGSPPPLRVIHLLSSASAVLAMVEKGMGLTICPALTVRSFRFNLDTVPMAPPLHRTLGIAAPRPALRSPVTETFLQFLSQRSAEAFEAVP